MKQLLSFIVIIVWTSAIAEPNTVPEPQRTEIFDALFKMYARDMQSSSGRSRWHGKVTKVLDAKKGIEIATYESGAVFTNDLMKTAQQRVYDANQRLKTFTDAKGFPKRLAEARKANAFAKTNTVEVTIELTAGK